MASNGDGDYEMKPLISRGIKKRKGVAMPAQQAQPQQLERKNSKYEKYESEKQRQDDLKEYSEKDLKKALKERKRPHQWLAEPVGSLHPMEPMGLLVSAYRHVSNTRLLGIAILMSLAYALLIVAVSLRHATHNTSYDYRVCCGLRNHHEFTTDCHPTCTITNRGMWTAIIVLTSVALLVLNLFGNRRVVDQLLYDMRNAHGIYHGDVKTFDVDKATSKANVKAATELARKRAQANADAATAKAKATAMGTSVPAAVKTQLPTQEELADEIERREYWAYVALQVAITLFTPVTTITGYGQPLWVHHGEGIASATFAICTFMLVHHFEAPKTLGGLVVVLMLLASVGAIAYFDYQRTQVRKSAHRGDYHALYESADGGEGQLTEMQRKAHVMYHHSQQDPDQMVALHHGTGHTEGTPDELQTDSHLVPAWTTRYVVYRRVRTDLFRKPYLTALPEVSAADWVILVLLFPIMTGSLYLLWYAGHGTGKAGNIVLVFALGLIANVMFGVLDAVGAIAKGLRKVSIHVFRGTTRGVERGKQVADWLKKFPERVSTAENAAFYIYRGASIDVFEVLQFATKGSPWSALLFIPRFFVDITGGMPSRKISALYDPALVPLGVILATPLILESWSFFIALYLIARQVPPLWTLMTMWFVVMTDILSQLVSYVAGLCRLYIHLCHGKLLSPCPPVVRAAMLANVSPV